MGRAFSLSSENFTALNAFTDVADISEYAKPFISGLVQESLVFGYPNGTIIPQGDITTAEVITMLERVHRYAEENATTDEPTTPEETTQLPQPNPPIFVGGGSRPRPPVTPPIEPDPPISPEVDVTFSDEDWTWESVTVTIDVTSNEEIVNVRWVRAESGGNTLGSIARIPYNFDYRLLFLFDMGIAFDPEEFDEVQAMFDEYIEELGEYADIGLIRNFIENSFREVGVDPNCGGWAEWAENPENFTDFSQPLVGDITTQQNGTFYIFAEDVEGNITIKEVFVGNIRTAQTELNITRHDPPINNDVVATVNIVNMEENPNAPVVERWLIPGRIVMVGGGFRDMNIFISMFVETAQNNGTVVAETSGEFSITELDMENVTNWGNAFTLVTLDTWGNYSFTTITI